MVVASITFIPDIINRGAIDLELGIVFMKIGGGLLGGGKASADQGGSGGPDLVVAAIKFIPDIINRGAIDLELGSYFMIKAGGLYGVDGEVVAVQVRIGGPDLVVAACISFIPDIINLGAITLELR